MAKYTYLPAYLPHALFVNIFKALQSGYYVQYKKTPKSTVQISNITFGFDTPS